MIRSLENSMPDYGQWAKGDQYLAAAESTRMGVSHSESKDVVLYTREGDKVTLSSSAQYEAKYATYEGLASTGGAMAWEKGEAFQMSAGMQFSLSIEGDLNEQERADIGKALKTIDKIMQDLVSGDLGNALKKTEKLGGLNTVQSLYADLQVNREMYYQHQEAAVASTGGGALERNRPADEMVPEATEADAETGKDALETAAVDKMAEAVESPFSGKMMSYVSRYFSELEERFAAREAEESPELNMIDRIRSRLLDRMEQMRGSDSETDD